MKPAATKPTPKKAAPKTMVTHKRTRARKAKTPAKKQNGILYFDNVHSAIAAQKKLRHLGFKQVNRGQDMSRSSGPRFQVSSPHHSALEMQSYLIPHENPKKKAAKKRRNATKKIAFSADKHGRKLAYIVSLHQMRNIRIPVAEAEHLIATGQAQKTPYRTFGKSNPDTAEEMYQTFHGRPPAKIKHVTEQEDYPVDVADCGKLLQLDVILNGSSKATELKSTGNVRLWTTPDGGQLYFHGGDQRLDLDALGLADGLPKDHLEIGPVFKIHYLTSKDFHDFEPVHYHHKFGEAGGRPPVLNYDTRNRRMYLSGGTYQVKREGIIN